MLHDVRFTLRQFAKSPGFTLVATLTLALAIGSNVAIFSAVDAVLLHPLPYAHPEQLVAVTENLTHFKLLNIPASPPEVMEYKQMMKSFSELGYQSSQVYTLSGSGTPENVPAMQISASILRMLDVKPVIGGLFGDDAEKIGNEKVVLVSEGLWKRRFGADASMIGRPIVLGRESYTVIGVVKPILASQSRADLWTPLAFTPQQLDPEQGLGRQFVNVFGRLKPGFSVEQARAEFHLIAAAIQRKYPKNYPPEFGYSLEVLPLVQQTGLPFREPLLILLAAVGAVMLIACSNISNLLLARAMLRRKEMSIRAALGAARSRVIRQLLTESLLLSIVGGAAGVMLAVWGLHLYSIFGPPGLIPGTQPALNLWVLGFSIALSIAASVVFGLAPALETSRIDLNEALKEGARGSSGGRRILRESMVALEVAMSVVLLIAAGLLVRSFIRLQRSDPGFDAKKILVGTVVLPVAQYKDAAQTEFRDSLLNRVRSLPGVTAASAIDLLPFSPNYLATSFTIKNHPFSDKDPNPVIIPSQTDGDYFRVMRIPILRGRAFTASDRAGRQPVAIIDETVARKFFANLDPLGLQISGPTAKTDYTIIGIAGAVKYRNLTIDPEPIIYYAAEQTPSPAMTLAVKTALDPLSLLPAVRSEIASLDPNLPLAQVGSEEDKLAGSLSLQRFSIQLMTVFAGIAALLAAIGIYGVLAYLIDQRRRELGIRIALGASRGDILGLVLRQGGLAVAIGMAIGLAGAFGVTSLLASLLYRVSAHDPLIFTCVALGLAIVSLIAMSIPARRATRVDPIDTLRQE